jgi:hypothetical protein
VTLENQLTKLMKTLTLKKMSFTKKSTKGLSPKTKHTKKNKKPSQMETSYNRSLKIVQKLNHFVDITVKSVIS